MTFHKSSLWGLDQGTRRCKSDNLPLRFLQSNLGSVQEAPWHSKNAPRRMNKSTMTGPQVMRDKARNIVLLFLLDWQNTRLKDSFIKSVWMSSPVPMGWMTGFKVALRSLAAKAVIRKCSTRLTSYYRDIIILRKLVHFLMHGWKHCSWTCIDQREFDLCPLGIELWRMSIFSWSKRWRMPSDIQACITSMGNLTRPLVKSKIVL